MTRYHAARCGRLAGLVGSFCLLGFNHAEAVSVTIDVKSTTGVPTPEAIVFLEPQVAVPATAPRTTVIDQVNKRFVPRVTVVRTGTSISFPNADNIRHQVYSFSDAKKFTLKLYAGSPRADIVFDRAGLVVLGCNIHDSMVAFVGVVDTPYFATTGASGTAVLDLPAGEYQLRVWHALLRVPIAQQHIVVAASPLALPLRLDLNPAGEQPAAWPE